MEKTKCYCGHTTYCDCDIPPEIKAKELYNSFTMALPDSGDISKQDIQDCCKVVVNEIISALEKICEYKSYDPFEAPLFELDYYKGVKEEINKL